MRKPRVWLLRLVGLSAAIAAAASWWSMAHSAPPTEIKFELGRGIVETAKTSDVPQFNVRDIQGFVSYSVNDIPERIPVRYAKPGYEVSWQPVFAFTMYADRAWHSDLKVQKARLQLNIDDMKDEQAHAFVEATLAQFQKGKWRRYADPELEVLLTGRSSILDVNGEVGGSLMAIDPNYKMSLGDWREVSRQGGIWRWVGDGVVAQLNVRNSPGADGKDWYAMELEFELLDAQRKRDAINLARDLKEGDAKGWNSTAEHEANKRKVAERNKLLKANAIKRGDAVVEIPLN